MQLANLEEPSSLVNTVGNVVARDGSLVVAGQFLGSVNISNAVVPRDNAARTCDIALFQTDPSACREDLENSKGRRVSGTCEWIKDDPLYQSWLLSSDRVLWIHGGPGKGKTMLSIFMTEELEQLAQQSVDHEALFFFCSYGDGRNTATAILRGLLWQLVKKRPDTASYIVQDFDTPEKARASVASPNVLWNALLRAVSDANLAALFCLIDGIDECDDESQRWFAMRLSELKKSHQAIKLAIVSRATAPMPCVALNLDEGDTIRRDIEKFISIRVESLSHAIGFDQSFRITIEHLLLERSEKTFLWIGFAMLELQSKKTAIEVEATLNALPAGLPAMYSRMLSRIGQNYIGDSSSILQWITLAARPLSLYELAAAVRTKPTPLLSRDQVIRDKVSICGVILKLQSTEVHLVHQSARDYLLREEDDNEDDAMLAQFFRIRPQDAHCQIAWACLDTLSRSSLHSVPLGNLRETPLALSDFLERQSLQQPLLKYALYHWFKHACYNSAVADRLMAHPSQIFAKKSKLRDEWWRVYVKMTYSFGLADLPSLHMACFLGCIPWAQMLMSGDRWKPKAYRAINKRDADGRKPLHFAVRSGHQDLLQRLLKEGANINACDDNGQSALFEALSTGQREIFELLVKQGANIHARSITGATLLHEAVSAGQMAILQDLLDHGADIEARIPLTGRTPLYSSVYSGKSRISKVLLELGANVNVQETEFGTYPLHEAASQGDHEIAQLLLNRGANIDAKAKYRATALQDAAERGHWHVVQLLQERGASVDVRDEEWLESGLSRWREGETVVPGMPPSLVPKPR